MPFVTRITLQSGDRPLLEDVVGDIKTRAARKGVELKGPHASPSTTVRVPQHKRLSDAGAGTFAPWSYTVYTRTLEIHGHDEFARAVMEGDLPPGVHVEADIEQVRSSGRP